MRMRAFRLRGWYYPAEMAMNQLAIIDPEEEKKSAVD